MSLKKIVVIFTVVSLVILGTYESASYSASQVGPPFTVEATFQKYDLKQKLSRLGAPKEDIEELASAIIKASEDTGISVYMLAALMRTESNFDKEAVSPKNYKGLMQTPYATMIWVDIDTLVGARILKLKLGLSKNNMIKALTLYKGGNNRLARKQALETMRLYHKIIS